MDLLDATIDRYAPLAQRMRPTSLAGYVGQNHILNTGQPLREALEQGHLHSMVFWGPPGVGKTTLAQLIAHVCDVRFESISAVLSGVKEIRTAVDTAQNYQAQTGKTMVLFVDEVHRFNKAQQDAFLPFIEDGTFIFIGATTENPSFELNNALLSRVRTYVLKTLSETEITSLIKRALSDDSNGLGSKDFTLDDEALTLLVQSADGDGRRALNFLEIAADLTEEKHITKETIAEVASQSLRRFDKGGEVFYDQISALHKSVRGSDPNAAVYWLCRMLDGGVDPNYIARRLTRMASEDIGNADPRALEITLNAWEHFERLGSPEGEYALSQAAIYLAAAPKSNAAYLAHKQAMADIRDLPSYEVPIHLRNAPTKLMTELGYGKAYRYAHDEPEAFAAGENYFPDEMEEAVYYQPTPRGLEIKIGEKLAHLNALNQQARANENDHDKSD